KARAPGRRNAVDYAKKNRGTHFGFALLTQIQARATEAEQKKETRPIWLALAKLWPLFEGVPGLETAARYEHARSLCKAGQRDQARQRFAALYAEALRQDGLLLFDADFRQA